MPGPKEKQTIQLEAGKYMEPSSLEKGKEKWSFFFWSLEGYEKDVQPKIVQKQKKNLSLLIYEVCSA